PIAIVHNGIIENAEELRAGLIAAGATFSSQTDSEIFAHLIAAHAGVGADSGDGPEPRDLEEAVRLALQSVVGTYGLAVLDARSPAGRGVPRTGPPVCPGTGKRGLSPPPVAPRLARSPRQVVHLDDGEIATLRADGFRTTTLDARRTTKQAA